jgi:hypothetical protein
VLDGSSEGDSDGVLDGSTEGDTDGVLDGSSEGDSDGVLDGSTEGDAEGFLEGAAVVGLGVGFGVGAVVEVPGAQGSSSAIQSSFPLLPLPILHMPVEVVPPAISVVVLKSAWT